MSKKNQFVSEQTELAKEQEGRLVKSLAYKDIVLFIVAAVISIDTIGTIASGGIQSLVWATILIIIFMVPYAMLFAETGSAFPEEGGPYQWVKYSFGRFWGGVTSVLYWITTPIWLGGSLAFIASNAFSDYVIHIEARSFWDWVFKLAYVWIAVLLAVMSLKTGKIFVNLGAWAKLTVMGLLVGTTVVYGFMHGFTSINWGDASPTTTGLLFAVAVLLFSYVGFEAPNAASEEMFDPARDTGPAIRRGTMITALAYLLPVLAIILVVPAKQASGLSGYMSAVTIVFKGVWGPLAPALIKVSAILFVIAVINLGSSWMIATDRTQAMAAADGTFFGGYFGVFNERFGTPLRVNISSGIIGSAFTIAAMLIVNGTAASAFGVVLNTAVSTLLFSYMIIVPAAIYLRKKYPDVERPYRMPGGNRGFYALSGFVALMVFIGSVATLFPGLLYKVLGFRYSYESTWGVSGTRFELFTVGTLLAVIVIAQIGYAFAGKVRKDIAKN